jgi:protein-tyrosine kinase
MSLVEQAARRLEELRKAGTGVAGDVGAHGDEREAGPPRESTIERAARKLDSLGVHRLTVELRRPAAPSPQAEAAPGERARTPEPAGLAGAEALPGAAPLEDDILHWGEGGRHEPRLGASVPADLLEPHPAAPARQLREVEQPPILRERESPVARTPAAQPPAAPGVAPGSPDALELDLQRLSGLGVLTPDKTDSALANQLRFIKRPLINAAQGKSPRPVANGNRIMVSSAMPGEGKSFIALNIAMSIAMERDSRVLLIDADTTRPSLSAILGATLSQGLLDLLTNPQLSPSQTLLRTNIERLTFLPSGTPRANATELLASEAMERLVANLASRYTDRILIFDAPPLLAAPEPPVLASYMGQIVVVVEAQRTTHKAVQHALASVESCPVVMTVLNKCEGNGGIREYDTRPAS